MTLIKYGMHLKSALSTTASVVTLILISVVIAIPLYLIMGGYVGKVSPQAVTTSVLVIEAVNPRTEDGKVYGLNLIIANHGPDPVTINNVSAYVVAGNGRIYETTLVLTEYPLKIPVGGVGEVILYPKENIPPGRYYIKLLTPGGGETITVLKLGKSVIGSKVALLTKSNTVSNPVIIEDSKCVYEAWVEYNASTKLYKVWFKFIPKPGVTIIFRRAELLNAVNNYPVWVAGNPYASSTSLTYPYYDVEYWSPIKPSEFPVKVVFTSVTK